MSRTRMVAAVVGAGTAATGLWAFAAPRSFYSFATYPPYSRHFIHDAGSFLIGLGAVVLLAAFASGTLFVALAGNAVGAWFHFVSHLIDRRLGANSGRDLATVGVIAAVLTVAALAARKESS